VTKRYNIIFYILILVYLYYCIALAISIKIVCSRSVESDGIYFTIKRTRYYVRLLNTYNINSCEFVTDHDDIGIQNNII